MVRGPLGRAGRRAIALSAAWAACVPVADVDAPDVRSPNCQARYDFPDDGDPATAALPVVENELLVQYMPGVDVNSRSAAYADADAAPIDEIGELNLVRLRIAPGTQDRTAGQLWAHALFEAIHKNYVFELQRVPNDPDYAAQPYLPRIRAPEAWDLAIGSARVVIAVVDSGVDRTHPDLTDKVIDGWNVPAGHADFGDDNGHGTFVAGVAAAMSDNGTGVTGMAWAGPVLAVRVSDEFGRATARDVAAGILWAVNHGAKVINVSFAPLWSNTLVQSAATHAWQRGAVVVISAGNGSGLASAAGYEQALFVGALDGADKLTPFSDRGPFVDLVAPGTAIYSTAPGGGYRAADGTSFAAPIVSGTLALAWSVNPDLRPITIVQTLLDSARDLGSPGLDDTFAGGAVDAYAAVRAASETTLSTDTQPPLLRVTAPAAGATLSGKARVTATAVDEWGVADVVLAIDGIPFASDDRTPYEFLINTATFSAGPHELSLVATDSSGNVSIQQHIRVTFGAGGTSGSSGRGTMISFRSPAAGTTVTGDVLLQATVSDADGLATVEWWIDGQPVFTAAISGASSGVSYLWRVSGSENGPHVISLRVLDATGTLQSANLPLTRR